MNWRDGDVFFWRYKKEGGDFTLRYWCRARKGIVRDGKLRDIYCAYICDHEISFRHEDGGMWSPGEAETHLTLEFKGNLDQFDAIPDGYAPMYDTEDILDLRHANSSQRQIYLRKGAKRSQTAMAAEVRYRIEKAERDIRYATYRLEKLIKDMYKIESGELEDVSL